MGVETFNWSELVCDVVWRISAGEDHAQILADLYYGIEAELELHSLKASEKDVERLAEEMFFWCNLRRGGKIRFTLFRIELIGCAVTA